MLRDRVQDVATDVDRRGTSGATAVLPGIGMVAGTPGLNAFGGVHAGFSPPRLASAIDVNGRDAQLSAERSVNYEVGARARVPRALRLEAAGFLVNFINQIVPATPAFGASSELINGGRTRHLGTESAATLMLGELLRAGAALDLGVRHTFVQAVFQGGLNDGKRVPYSPSHIVTTTADLELPWGLGGQFAWHHVAAQYTDERNTEAPDPTGRVGKLDAYNVLDLGLRYRWEPARMTASLLVKNALDDVYIASRRPDGIFTAGSRQIIAGLRFEQ
jgi:Fe(3+) dicitrate transport protein